MHTVAPMFAFLATLASGELAGAPQSKADRADEAPPTIEARSPAQAALLRYVVSCALRPDQTAMLMLDDQRERLVGELALAPTFLRSPSASSRRVISACVLARTNYSGRHVVIRYDAAYRLTSEDLVPRQPARYEAAFFGDLYAAPPQLYVCALGAGERYENALRAAHRLCALPDSAPGRSMCGFEHLGPCSRAAFRRDAIDYYWTAMVVSMPTP